MDGLHHLSFGFDFYLNPFIFGIGIKRLDLVLIFGFEVGNNCSLFLALGSATTSLELVCYFGFMAIIKWFGFM